MICQLERGRRLAAMLAHGSRQDDGRGHRSCGARSPRRSTSRRRARDRRGHRRRVTALVSRRWPSIGDGSKTAQALRTDTRRTPGAVDTQGGDLDRAARPRPWRRPRRSGGGDGVSASRSPTGGRRGYITPGMCARTARVGGVLPHRHRQGRLDAARDDELIRDRDLDTGCRSRRWCASSASRARGHDLQPGDPVAPSRCRARRPLAGVPLPGRRPAGGTRILTKEVRARKAAEDAASWHLRDARASAASMPAPAASAEGSRGCRRAVDRPPTGDPGRAQHVDLGGSVSCGDNAADGQLLASRLRLDAAAVDRGMR